MNEKNIGALSKFVGVPAHTIKYYEKIGLLTADRDEKSNYRRYSVKVCTDIFECIKYRNMGFSLKELDLLKKSVREEELEEMLEARVNALNEEVSQAEQMRDKTRQYYKDVVDSSKYLGEWFIERCPYIYIRQQTSNLEYQLENSLEMEQVNLTDYFPKMKSCATVEPEYLMGQEPQFSWGQGITSEEPLEVLEQNACFTRVSGKKAFVTYVRDTGNYLSEGTIVKQIRKIYGKYDKKLTGTAYLFRIKIIYDEDGCQWHYFKVYIPME